MKNLIVAFRNFGKAPKIIKNYKVIYIFAKMMLGDMVCELKPWLEKSRKDCLTET